MSGQLRIISGRWRGRKLQLPQVEGVRPTPDRVRETLFNWLAADIPIANCLDLFAGSGALGWEALSRGAAQVTFVERSRQVFRHLKASAEQLQCDNANFYCYDALAWLQRWRSDTAFNIIFADPPFYKGLAQKTATIIQQRGLLQPDGYLYLEVERRYLLEENLPQWEVVRTTRAGEAVGWLLQLK